MFRFAEVFVDDDKLGAFIKAAAALKVRMSNPMPVDNLRVARNGQLRARTNAGNIQGLLPDLAAHFTKHKLKEVRPNDVREFITGIGYAPTSYSVLMRAARDAKMLIPLKLKPGENRLLTRYKVAALKVSKPKTNANAGKGA